MSTKKIPRMQCIRGIAVSKSDLEVVKDFKSILESSDAEYALRFIFMVRDAREGLGERRLFRLCVKELLNKIIRF